MIWTSLFIISIAQGLFLISLIALKGSKNPIATRLIITMVMLMVFTNFGYLVSRTPLTNSIPYFFAVPFGMILLYGPLMYFYSKSVLDSGFYWKQKYWLHFIPYLIQVCINLPLYTANKEAWGWFNQTFLAGELPIQSAEKIAFAIQDIQLFIYLIITYRWVHSAKSTHGNAQFIISVSARLRWVKQLTACFLIFLITVFTLYLIILFAGFYQPVTNYIYTIVISAVIYFIAYSMVLKPELIILDFTKKYKAYKSFDNPNGDDYVQKIKTLLGEKKIFTNAELKLATIAEEVGLPQHQLSKLINEKFGKSFNDLINEYRVQEFITRINQPEFQSFSIFGVALDVGFNTKSSFNSTFKKFTGKTPSEFRKSE